MKIIDKVQKKKFESFQIEIESLRELCFLIDSIALHIGELQNAFHYGKRFCLGKTIDQLDEIQAQLIAKYRDFKEGLK